jgi:AhpD family alkylhydroperoxidase
MTRPYLDKTAPAPWKAVNEYSTAVNEAAAAAGLSKEEVEYIKLRASQLNACPYCLDVHSREARAAGIVQQKLDVLPSWRDSALFTEREKAMLAIAEAATRMPLTENSEADLAAARGLLGDEVFAAAEWVAVTINVFNRISILSEHPVRPRDAEGNVIR